MTEDCDHLFSLSVFAPASLLIHIGGRKTHSFGSLQNVFETLVNFLSVGETAVIFSVDAGNTDTALQIPDQFQLLFFCIVSEIQ